MEGIVTMPAFFKMRYQCINPIYLRVENLEVPCGKCGHCLMRRIQDYTARCYQEWKSCSEKCYFVTLTYENDPVQLYKKDLQDFFKRLRKVGFSFSYFALGDYGDTFGRPHYHVLFFVKGFFLEEYLWSLWISGRDQVRRRGFVHTLPLTGGRISYVIRYGFLAKLDWNKEDGRRPPFFLLSKRPAIGLSYLTPQMVAFHKNADIWYYPDGKWKKPLPRYWRDRIFSKLELEIHSDKYLEQLQDRLASDLEKLSASSTNPEANYVDRIVSSSNQFLEGLRAQKKLKNKML